LAKAAGDRAGKADRAVPLARMERAPATFARRNSPSPPRRTLPACPELDCLRHLLPPGIIAAAELRASEAGVGADRALIAADIISEEAYLAALTGALGIPFEPLDDMPRAACPLNDERLIEATAVGILPMIVAGDLKFVVAPRALAARKLIEAVRSGSELATRIRLTTADRLQQFVARHGARALAHRASQGLREARPDLSAGCGAPRPVAAALLLGTLLLILLAAPGKMMAFFDLAFGLVFLAWAGLRLMGLLTTHSVIHRPKQLTDDRLPVYTIIVALYREAAAVKDLIGALRRLDYPKEKLDIKLVLEADDRETRARLETMRLCAPFELVIAPAVAPRTKPKALNAALPSARGTFVAIYDAEDRPEPDQLRRALDAFAAGDERLACAQARLTIDNTADSWLVRLFTAEYAGLFDVFLPSLAAWKLPLPLGGSSNHFRADVLRRIGAWDPYNVTEDADLGMRLARHGYRTTIITSTTYEEAPARLHPWLKQRTRWFKGWMQTWLVHMRTPRTLMRELGLKGFIVFQLLVGGSALAALVHPLFLIELLWEMASAGSDGANTAMLSPLLHAATLLIGYLASIALALVGLKRRRLLDCAWTLVLMPLYWLLLSFAAWRALDQLLRDPYRWEKTEHGLARNSRLMEESDTQTASVRSSAAVRPRNLPAGA
jgi:cellulose synthase/poly-beta-1,6-N-acetylglucosamine synthase-like glycosyltransferase